MTRMSVLLYAAFRKAMCDRAYRQSFFLNHSKYPRRRHRRYMTVDNGRAFSSQKEAKAALPERHTSKMWAGNCRQTFGRLLRLDIPMKPKRKCLRYLTAKLLLIRQCFTARIFISELTNLFIDIKMLPILVLRIFSPLVYSMGSISCRMIWRKFRPRASIFFRSSTTFWT